ncbi:MAG TPA: DCC1-like thiol-disulfide oxidoreductase family protein [Candidatus Obscuribacterales bacterium]
MTFRDLLAKLDNWFFKPRSPVPLALFRILVGLLLLQTVLVHHVPDWHLYYSDNAFLPRQAIMAHWWQFDPIIDFLALLPAGDTWKIGFFAVLVVAALFMTVGFLTPYAVPIVFLMLLSINKHFPYNWNGGDSMMQLALFLLAFGRSGDALSLDNLIRSAKDDWRKVGFEPVHSPPWVQRMLQLQLALAYLDTFLWKATGSKWIDGSALYYALRLREYIKLPLPPLLDTPLFMRVGSWMTLIIEFALCTFIWFKDVRYYVLLSGLLLHLGIDYCINLPVFEWMFLSMYVLFIEPEDLSKFWRHVTAKIEQLFGPPRRLTFDGHCLLCVRGTGIFHRMDIFGRYEFVDFRRADNRDRLKDLDFERAEREMMVETEEGWQGGFKAFRIISRSMPLLWFLLPLLYLPLISFIGERIYGLIAENRYLLLGRCDDTSCSLHATAYGAENCLAKSGSASASEEGEPA